MYTNYLHKSFCIIIYYNAHWKFDGNLLPYLYILIFNIKIYTVPKYGSRRCSRESRRILRKVKFVFKILLLLFEELLK